MKMIIKKLVPLFLSALCCIGLSGCTENEYLNTDKYNVIKYCGRQYSINYCEPDSNGFEAVLDTQVFECPIKDEFYYSCSTFNIKCSKEEYPETYKKLLGISYDSDLIRFEEIEIKDAFGIRHADFSKAVYVQVYEHDNIFGDFIHYDYTVSYLKD